MATQEPKPFFGEGEAIDREYVLVRDRPDRAHIRKRVEEMWESFQPICPDNHFLIEARTHFNVKVWEMYLACVLMNYGFTLEPAAEEGPDLKLKLGAKQCWVEAIAPQPGDRKKDGVPPPPDKDENDGRPYFTYRTDDRYILRYIEAVRTKNDKYAKDLGKNIVGPSDPYVLAISGGDLDLADTDSGWTPAFIKAVLSPEKTLRAYDGRVVYTDAFLQEDYKGISGILFSPWSITNGIRPTSTVGRRGRDRATRKGWREKRESSGRRGSVVGSAVGWTRQASRPKKECHPSG